LYQAQFDTSDLFFELSANLVRPNGFIAFIVPDSIFNHDKQRVRQLILKQFKIVLIARLGEKIFPNINRACIVLIAQRVEKIQPSHAVTCFRLTPHLRKQILSGQVGFQELEDTHSYKILQSRFSKNKDSLFNIDLRSEEEDLFNKFNTKSTIGDYLTSTRGVELSKSGKIVQCSQCESWMPLPTKEDFTCQHCKTKLSLQSVKTASIITPVKQKGAVPFIAGEHIHRYSAQSKLWLNASYEGINYKSANTYQSPKLLVRKTGVGISASIDVSNAWTNQVVYIFKPLPLAKKLPLELFLGILNSRALYYYLIKKHGEIEWRSHPYLTQKQIAELPFPSLAQLSKNQKSVEIISMHVGKIIAGQRQPTLKEDAWIEKEVARLFNLTREDYKLILSSFVGLEQLAPVRAVSNLTINDIFKS
ncbi:MAG: hypothetical protein EBQ92_08015, partial [Proteobacteria bacterium]|nr:hypothetical protein [Pseudomonadota bacterium]